MGDGSSYDGSSHDGGHAHDSGCCCCRCCSCVAGVPQTVVRLWRTRLNDVSPCILMLYCVNNLVVSVPMLANYGYLNDIVHMEGSDISNYYAFIFVPYSLKPLYAVILEKVDVSRVGIGSRKLWLVVTSLLSAVLFLVQAHLTHTVVAAFFVGFLHSVCFAFNELVLGVGLVDAANRNMKNAGALQGFATACRFLGTLIGTLVSLALYSCGNHGTWSPRRVLELWGGFALLGGIIAAAMPERPRRSDQIDPAAGFEVQESDAERRQGIRGLLRVLALILSLEALLVWNSLQHFIEKGKTLSEKPLWWSGIGFFTLLFIVAVSSTLAAAEGLKGLIRKYQRFAPPALFLLLISSIPSSGVQYDNFLYALYKGGGIGADAREPKPCWSVYQSIASSAGQTLGCLLYAPLANARDVRVVMFLGTMLSVATGLLSIPVTAVTSTGQTVDFLGHSVDLLTYTLVTAVILGAVGRIGFIPRQVLATQCCPSKSRVIAYASYLSAIDAGDSINQWLAAPIVDAVGITRTSYHPGLRNMIWLHAGLMFVVVCLVPLVSVDRARYDVDAGGSDRSNAESLPLIQGCESAAGDSPHLSDSDKPERA
eukprot:TRINITY_DN1287_c0_g1_i1.p1 TRINITY_DN1287_c0_g1~~TRINITY_DN1287_c0_g1_i1.p1  ORF type:complete len:614 (+),score=148.41 TRINITY_DN1287_c0_g1_i1:56-1843(+)